MKQIKLSDLENLVAEINEVTNSPKEYATTENGKFHSFIGHYHLDRAYGGNKLVRTMNHSGGIEEVTRGFISKRELYEQMKSFLMGLKHK